MKAFFLLCAFALCCCLHAEEDVSKLRCIPPPQCGVVSTENTPVNTRLSERSELAPELNQDLQAEEMDAESLPSIQTSQELQEVEVEVEVEEDVFAEQPQITLEEMAQQSTFTKALCPSSLNTYQHYFFGPAVYKVTRCLCEALENGSYVVLGNGSVWKMAESDFWKIAGWATTDRIQLTRNNHLPSRYPYILRNLENGERIRAIVRVGPQYSSPLYCSCAGFCTFSGDVWCSNGTMWWVAHEDSSILATWNPEDVIMVGINENSMRRQCPYILFNLTNSSCCRAAWTR